MSVSMDDLKAIYGDIVEDVPEEYHEDFKKAVNNQRSAAGTVAAIKAYNEEFDHTVEEAVQELDASRNIVTDIANELGYRDEVFEEEDKHKAMLPEKFRPVFERHVDSGKKPNTITAAIYSETQDVDYKEAAETFDTTRESVKKYTPKVRKYLGAEQITEGENLNSIYSSTNPIMTAIESDPILKGKFDELIEESSERESTPFDRFRRRRASDAIKFILTDQDLYTNPGNQVSRMIEDMIYGVDGVGLTTTADILSEKTDGSHKGDILEAVDRGFDPRVAAHVILKNETDLSASERAKKTGVSNVDNIREDINSLLEK